MEIKLEFKDKEVFSSFARKSHHHKLVALLYWFYRMFGTPLITESYRYKRHPNDLHGTTPVRATDIRSKHYKWPQEMADGINSNWQYDPLRPEMTCCVYHESEPGKGDWHFHLQVHPRTVFRGVTGSDG